MASSDDALETYTHIPVEVITTVINQKGGTSLSVASTSADPSVQREIAAVNAILSSRGFPKENGVHPNPPIPVLSKITSIMNALREKAVADLKKNNIKEALRQQTQAIETAASRVPWEPVGLVREEMALCYMERASTHILLQNWAEAWKDAECSLECKKGPQQLPNGQKTPGNPGAWMSGGKALMAMGRWSEAVAWLQQGVEVEDSSTRSTQEIKTLLAQAKAELATRSGHSQIS